MFREAFERGAEIGAGPIARLWRQALLLASRNWQLESLYRSNAKYQPEWQPRFICFEYASDLPRVGTAAGSAEGFLTRPSLSLLHRAQASDAADALDTGRRGVRRRGRGADPAGARPAWPRRCRPTRLPEQVRVRRDKLRPAAGAGHRPVPGRLPAHPHARAGARRGRRARRRTPRPGARSR